MSAGTEYPTAGVSADRRPNYDIEGSVQGVQTLTLPILYEADPRPTMILDITLGALPMEPAVVYTNRAMRDNKDLFHSVRDALRTDTRFCFWALSSLDQGHYYRYAGSLWFGFMLHERWKIISKASSFLHHDFETQAPSTPSSLRPSNHMMGARITPEATMGRLKEEIRAAEIGQRQAAQEEHSCSETVQRLRHELKAFGATTPRSNLSKASSVDSLFSLSQQAQVPQLEQLDPPRADLPKTSEITESRDSQPQRQRSPFSPPSSKAALPIQQSGGSDDSVALEKFQRLAEAVDVGFFDYDTSGRLLHANESWYALSGHPRDPNEHTALSFNKCVYPDDAELVMHQWTKLMKGEAVTFEMRWKKPAPPSAGPNAPFGSQWVLSACVPVIGEDGKVTSISGCTTDIDAQKHSAQVALQRAEALERARASEERFTRFAEFAPIAIFRFDRHKNVEYCNDRWFEMTGLPKTPFEEIAWPFGVYEDDIEMCSQAWSKSIEDHSIGQIEFRLRKEWHDNHGRRGQAWVYCTFFAEFFEDGSFNGLMGSLLDISHIKWAENTQKLRAEEALEAKRQQENFIDITSHEMRNPLSAMVQCADSIMTSFIDTSKIMARRNHLRTAEENEQLREHIDTGLDAVQTILSCAAHQRRIVDDILTLSKLDSNLLLITPVKTDPVEMVQQVIKMFEMDSTKADVGLTRELDQSFADLDVHWLMLDPSRVSQILINLLGNAIKFTRSEMTRRVTVKMSASLEPPSKYYHGIDYVPAETILGDTNNDGEANEGESVYLKIEVQDTGRGLTPEEKEKLFMRFSQASPKTHVQYGGSGLGLFISRKLTEMQGGEIGFASQADVGSTFAFYIETKRTTPPVSESSMAVPQSAADNESVPTKEMPRKHINVLLVEDNLVNQKVLGKQLERQGCTVFIAGHGVEALDFLKSTDVWTQTAHVVEGGMAPEPARIDVVLMDIEMPVMGGLECSRRIRDLEKEGSIVRHLPIISISANARQEQVNEAKAAGVDDAITKPFRIKELMPKLYKLTGPSPSSSLGKRKGSIR